MASEEMGGTALEDRSDMGMMCSLETLGATVAFLGAGRELISQRLEPPLIADDYTAR
jgi:hypothetical protein